MDIVIATHNQGKLREYRRLFAQSGHTFLSLSDVRCDIDVIEDGDTFQHNSRKKAVEIANATGRLALADDSGLVVDALNGAPGVHSARYAGESARDEDNWRKLLHALEGEPNRAARFICVLTLATPHDDILHIAEGHCEGTIATAPAGEHGFGYDPIFIPTHHTQTMACLSPDEKNRISHRAAASQQMAAFLTSI